MYCLISFTRNSFLKCKGRCIPVQRPFLLNQYSIEKAFLSNSSMFKPETLHRIMAPNRFEENFTRLEHVEAKKLITKVQKELVEGGIENPKVVETLKELRPYAIEEKDPTVTRVLRMCYEHIEEFEGFNIGVPVDEEDDDVAILEEGLDLQSNSLYYLMSLLVNSTNERNREEIFFYRDALKRYWRENA